MKKSVLACDKVGLRALFDINFSLYESECLMIMGLRGNSQQELADIITGAEFGYAGNVFLDGKKMRLHSLSDANRQGIYLIRDLSSLIGNLRLSENVFLMPQSAKSSLFIRTTQLNHDTDQLFQELGLKLTGEMYGSECDVFEQHAVIAARALARGARILVFEDTMSLYTDDQIDKFCRFLQVLKKRGVAVILFASIITDVFKYANRVLVLRNATIAHIFEQGDIRQEDLFWALTQSKKGPTVKCGKADTGREDFIQIVDFAPEGYVGAPLNLSMNQSSITSLITDDIQNADMILKSMFGEIPFKGSLYIEDEKCVFKCCADAIAMGIGLIKGEINDNLFSNFSAAGNTAMMLEKRTQTFGDMGKKQINQYVAYHAADKYEIQRDLLKVTELEELPNINKIQLILLRWLVLNPKLLLFMHPYYNLDEVERMELSKAISRIAAKGVTILIISTLTSDVVNISDTIRYLSNSI